MKKPRKPRATFASLAVFRGVRDMYVIVVPYDRRGREILSSVNCVFNADYFSPEEAQAMVNAL